MVSRRNQQVRRQKMSQRAMQWSIRKLNVGVASVAVAVGMFLAGGALEVTNVAHADTLAPAVSEQADTDQAQETTEDQPKAVVEDTDTTATTTEETATTTDEETADQAATADDQTDAKTEDAADVETENSADQVTNDQATADATTDKADDKTTTETPKKAEKAADNADRAATSKDVTADLTDQKVQLKGSDGNQLPDTIRPHNSESLKVEYSFTVPDSVNAGDTFKVGWSKNLNLYGVSAPNIDVQSVFDANGNVIARGQYDKEAETIEYTFTDYVTNHQNVKARLELPLFIDPEYVLSDSTQALTAYFGDVKDAQNIKVSYDKYIGPEGRANGEAFVNNVDHNNNTFTHTVYVNPYGATLTNQEIYIRNQNVNETGKTSGIIYNPNITNFKIYRVKNLQNLNHSFWIDPDNVVDITNQVYYAAIQGNSQIAIKVTERPDNSTYIIQYTTEFDPQKDIAPRVIMIAQSQNGQKYQWSWDNYVQKYTGNSDGGGDQTQPGKFIEHHVYETYVDGQKVDEKVVDETPQEGNKNEQYQTGKKETDGFTFVKTDNPVNIPTYNEDGSDAAGNFVPGQTQEITYVYRKDLYTGGFQEHHVYETYVDGKKVNTETVDGTPSRGTEDKEYTTGKQEKDGFTFVETKDLVNDPTYNEDGSQENGHFVAKKDQEITYVYRKDLYTGSFQEHHIYETYVNGKKVNTETVDGTTERGTEDKTYTTGRKEKDGFTFVETKDPVNNPTFNKDGSDATGHFVAKTNQEITYVYRKDITVEPGKFVEHHIYETYVDGKKVSDETVDSAPQAGLDNEEYTTGKKDKDGFTFVETKAPVNNPTFNKDGNETTGNFVPGETQEITYVYRKDLYTGGFQEHHVYETYVNGKLVNTTTVNGTTERGTEDKTYTTGKKDKDGFTFVETKDPVNNPTFNKDGSEATGHFVAKTNQEITYVYRKDVTVEPGKFVEHHVYETYVDGEKVSDETVDSAPQAGLDNEEYTTGKKDKEGFTFVETKDPVNNPTFNEDGSETTGNFVPGQTQEITYVYRKDLYTGGFQEHHVYETYVNGKKVNTETVNGTTERGTEDKTYTTGKKDKDGFTFVETKDPVNNPIFNKDGSEATGHFVAKMNQEITYVYRKDVTVEPGKFVEHHIYETYVDGKKVSDKTVDSAPQAGLDNEEYTTGKKDKDGFTFVKTDKPVNDPTYNEDGSQATGNFVPGETQEITYVYRKDLYTGGFQEHHVYETYVNGKLVNTETVNGTTERGTEDKTYTTGKKDKDGFTFVETKAPVNNPTFNKDGSEATGHFVAKTNQEITYVYRKDITVEPGKFIEHHVYENYVDGKKVTEEVVNSTPQEGLDTDQYQTGKKDKDGYTFTKVENPVNNPSYNKDGSETSGHFVPGKTQEVTYVYRKDQYTGKFVEHHIYETYVDGKKVSQEVVDGTPQKGLSTEEYLTGKKDKDGFTFSKVENPINNPTYDKDGHEVSGHFVPGETQEITYVYRKDVTTPEKPEKPEEPTTPDSQKPEVPGKPTTPETPEQKPGVPVGNNESSNKNQPMKETEKAPTDSKQLPQTGAQASQTGLLGAVVVALGGLFTFGQKKERNDK
ncbi:MAG: MucBP domain-containing protein [Aerococcus sp.]|nr:MucBP domain-containing protein [Aerococcus sp.]